MASARSNQNGLDWFTQQWNILFGRKLKLEADDWLLGPFGREGGIGEQMIEQLAQAENLIIQRNLKDTGLIPNIKDLELSEAEMAQIHPKIIDFYQKTANYDLQLNVKWNPFFKPFGHLVSRIFSQRINQLNIPLKNHSANQDLSSEIIQLVNLDTNQVKYIIWLRKFKSTDQVIYSGIYGLSTNPQGKTFVKANFPLPNGSATVILEPIVGSDQSFILRSKGKQFGDAGFYFLLQDKKDQIYSQYLPSFADELTLKADDKHINAIQVLRLWGLKVVQFDYSIKQKND